MLLGNGNGTFQTQVTYAAGNAPYALASGDFNLDRKPDPVVANHTDCTVSILLGNGDGTFQTQVIYGAGVNPYYVTVCDLNGDGKPDLALPTRSAPPSTSCSATATAPFSRRSPTP